MLLQKEAGLVWGVEQVVSPPCHGVTCSRGVTCRGGVTASGEGSAASPTSFVLPQPHRLGQSRGGWGCDGAFFFQEGNKP